MRTEATGFVGLAPLDDDMPGSIQHARGPRIRGFDGLRAIAALLVFCEHKVTRYTIGALGVWVFFVLSGHLISGILYASAGQVENIPRARQRALRVFWKNRALRILPIYYLTLLGLFAFTPLVNREELIFYAAYLQNFYIGLVTHAWTPITHFWSLAIEQQFYLIAAPTLLWLAPKNHLSLLVWTLVVCLASVAVAEFLGIDPMVVSLLPTTNFSFIALGGVLKLAPTHTGISRALGHSAVTALALLTFACTFAIWTRPDAPTSGTPWPIFLSGLALSGSIVAWVVAHPDHLGVRLLELRVLRWLGTISYGFYVYHALIPGPEAVFQALGIEPFHVPWRVWNGVQLLISLGLAQASYVCIERPLLRFKER